MEEALSPIKDAVCIPLSLFQPDSEFWLYKQPWDTGFAPCVEIDSRTGKPLLTLATCKKDIRLAAQKGHTVIGISGNDDGNRLRYIANITDILEPGEYYREAPWAKHRLDCIYEDDGTGYARWNGTAERHLGENFLNSDVGEDFGNGRVLLSEYGSYYYPGADGKNIFAGHSLLSEYIDRMRENSLHIQNRGSLYKALIEIVVKITLEEMPTWVPRFTHPDAPGSDCGPKRGC